MDQNFTKIEGIRSEITVLETKSQYSLLLSIQFTTADVFSILLQGRCI